MRRYLLSAVMILAFASCERMPEMSDIEEIGSPQKEVVVEYESGTTSVQIMSNGEFTATLPADADVWGKSKVYVRLIPISKAAGTRESYDGGSISSKYYSALNYFAVRYNK